MFETKYTLEINKLVFSIYTSPIFDEEIYDEPKYLPVLKDVALKISQ